MRFQESIEREYQMSLERSRRRREEAARQVTVYDIPLMVILALGFVAFMLLLKAIVG